MPGSQASLLSVRKYNEPLLAATSVRCFHPHAITRVLSWFARSPCLFELSDSEQRQVTTTIPSIDLFSKPFIQSILGPVATT